MSIDTILSVEDGIVKLKLAKLLLEFQKNHQKLKTLLEGLPRVADLFEAKKTKRSSYY